MDWGFCFRPERGRGDCSGILHLWVADYAGEVEFMPTAYDIRHEEWDAIGEELVLPGGCGRRRRELARYAEKMASDMLIVERIVGECETPGRCTAADVISRLRESSSSLTTPN